MLGIIPRSNGHWIIIGFVEIIHLILRLLTMLPLDIWLGYCQRIRQCHTEQKHRPEIIEYCFYAGALHIKLFLYPTNNILQSTWHYTVSAVPYHELTYNVAYDFFTSNTSNLSAKHTTEIMVWTSVQFMIPVSYKVNNVSTPLVTNLTLGSHKW